IRQFARRQYSLDRYPSLQTAVIPNFNNLQRLTRPKAPAARRTLGMVGYANRNKDPLFAVRTLALLAAQDPTWRLRLVGSDWKDVGPGKEADYRAEFEAFVERSGLASRIDY